MSAPARTGPGNARARAGPSVAARREGRQRDGERARERGEGAHQPDGPGRPRVQAQPDPGEEPLAAEQPGERARQERCDGGGGHREQQRLQRGQRHDPAA
jgi:hypothetical protein